MCRSKEFGLSGVRFDPEKIWYSRNIVSVLLLPLSWLFRAAAGARRLYYRVYHHRRIPPSVFILVVGNLTVGGTGKTPFVIWLARRCRDHGLNVGVVSRGYRKRKAGKIVDVQPDSLPEEVGDEALLLVQKISCPVVAAADRMQAVSLISRKYKPDVILSDDGLQHYKLPRNVEILVVDGDRRFGNGRCLPAGPLREPVSRARSCDLVVSNGCCDGYEYSFEVVAEDAVSLCSDTIRRPLQHFKGCCVHAVAGLGNPTRFFRMLENAGIRFFRHVFPDHHSYTEADLEFGDDEPILMTEKDALKCKLFVDRDIWYLPIIVLPNPRLEQRISNLIEGIPRGQTIA
ncbi:MAG: tetraacyldisaccharide 4'-kinase [Gammaproteobacteria bacterium]|nr:tetraacyldisaccharide 4'-kinase [Gammaproteobacteria bacterium]